MEYKNLDGTVETHGNINTWSHLKLPCKFKTLNTFLECFTHTYIDININNQKILKLKNLYILSFAQQIDFAHLQLKPEKLQSIFQITSSMIGNSKQEFENKNWRPVEVMR